MRDTLRTTLLFAAVLSAIGTTTAYAADAADAPRSYLIRYAEPGLFESRAGFDAARTAAALEQARVELVAAQRARSQAMRAALGRMPVVTHHYLASHSGIAAQLTPAEAERVRGLPGVADVRPDGVEYLDTFRTPAFIHADAVWNGVAVPGLPGSRGEGTVVAVIDTGITPGHPSFADDPSCPADGLGAKLLSYVDCSTTDENGRCNGTEPLDAVGHGTHTAATAAGSFVPADGARPAVSGVAPCAHIRAYKACPGLGCTFSGIYAGLDNILLDGDVDALNFSIAGGTDPWNDPDRVKLDLVANGIFVAASAGNTTPSQPYPVGRVNHLGPWVTTVAATTHDVWADGLLDVADPAAPAALTDIQLYKTSDAPNLTTRSGLPIRHYDAQSAMFEGCSAGLEGAPADLPAFPPGYFAGAAALVRNAGCAPATQIANAFAAGAELVLIRATPSLGAIELQTQGQPPVPAYGIALDAGEALAAHVAAQADVRIDVVPVQGDALGVFSLRGPTPGVYRDLTKPNLAAPGVRIFAASSQPPGYATYDGTSMASPHVAGAAALVRSVRPDWSVPEIASALMTTAKAVGVDDTWARGWTWDQVGSGRIDVAAAVGAGLLLDESVDHFLAADPAAPSLDLRDLNLPSLRDTDCAPSCTWVRGLRSALDTAGEWTVSVEAATPGLQIEVSPVTFTLAGAAGGEGVADRLFADGFDPASPGRDQVLAITATPPPDGALAFGRVILTETGGRAPPQHLTVVASGRQAGSGRPQIATLPAAVTARASASGGIVSQTLTVANHDSGALTWAQTHEHHAAVLWEQAPSGSAGVRSSRSTTQNGGVYTANDFRLRARTVLTTIRTPGLAMAAALTNQPITWAIYPDDGGAPAGDPELRPGQAIWTHTTPADGAGVAIEDGTITLDLAAAGQDVDLPAGVYWLSVFPTYANAVTGTAAHWRWLQATRADLGTKLISPVIYGVSTWSPISVIGVSFDDTAFTIEGRIGGTGIDCAAPWLQLAPSSGEVPGSSARQVSLRLDPRQLAPGTHTTSLCIDSNDPYQPTLIVPVTLTVDP